MKEAKRELLAATSLSPDHSLAYIELGNAYEQLGDMKRATTAFEKALRLDETLTVVKQKLDSNIAAVNY